ncbi:hypothetical protein BGZ80_010505, partial [Entomortierella chlamydospora]
MPKNNQTPNEVPENTGNVELLEYPEGSERDIYQEVVEIEFNPLPLGNLAGDGQLAVDASRPVTGETQQNIVDALEATPIITANETRMSTGHFEGLSSPLIPGENSLETTEVNPRQREATNTKKGDTIYLQNEVTPAVASASLISVDLAGPGVDIYERFFTKMLAEIDTPSLPYGLSDVRIDGADVTESHLALPQALNDSLRDLSKRNGVSLSSLCHLAWAQVISKTSGQEQVVFGTVLSGRIQAALDSDQAMGPSINTLPIRIDVGEASVEESVRRTQIDLTALRDHEHASLALALRCSSVPPGTPLFSSVLNYRYNAAGSCVKSVSMLDEQERTNYPFMISIEDGDSALSLTAQVAKQFDASRICGYMQQTLQSLVDAFNHTPNIQVRCLEIIPATEREVLIQSWNATDA